MTKLEKLELRIKKLEEEIRYNKSIEGLYNKGLLNNEDMELLVEIAKSTDYSLVGISVPKLMKRGLNDFLDEYESIIGEELDNKVKEKWDFWRRLGM